MQLERGLGHRQTRDPDRLASQEFPVVLEREVASWSATNSWEHPQAHRANGTKESDLGTSARVSGAVGEAGYLCFSTYSTRLLASRAGATGPPEDLFAELEDVCPQSRPVNRRLRFPGRGDRPFPNSLCVRPDGGRDTAHRALQRHRASNGSLDLAAASRSDPQRSFLPFPDPWPRFDLLGRGGPAAQSFWIAGAAHARASAKSKRPLWKISGNYAPGMFGFHDSAGGETPAQNPGRVGYALQPRAPYSLPACSLSLGRQLPSQVDY